MMDRWQQQFLAQAASYTMLRAVIDYESARTAAVESVAGGTFTWEGRRGWYQTTAKGYGWDVSLRHGYASAPSDFELFVPWLTIRDHVAERRTQVPDLRDRCLVVEKERVDHALSSRCYPPRWHRVPFAVHLNPDGQTYEECDQWTREVYWPKGREIDVRRKALVAEILPLTVDDEPVDLLELLAANG